MFYRDELRKINIKRVKKISLTHPTTYQFTQLHFIFRQFIPFLLSLFIFINYELQKNFDPNALKRPVTRSKTAHERERQSGM